MEAVMFHMMSTPGNPSSIHSSGRNAHAVLEHCRADIARLLGAEAREVVFTSGGSESNNLAIRGAAHARAHAGRHIIVSAIEHESVLHTCAALVREGFRVTYLDVDASGRVAVEALANALEPDTILVSVMHANNEIGIIQPIAELTRAIKQRRPDILFHSDAVQTVGHIAVDVNELGVDMLSFTAHKFYGPKGIGGLYVRQGVPVEPQIVGGGQECNLRSGTECVPLAAGMAEALQRAVRAQRERSEYWRKVRDAMARELLESIPDSHINGPLEGRLATNLNMSFLGVTGEDLVLRLDRRGIQASTGSACAAAGGGTSHVLAALAVPGAWAKGSLRLTFGEACREIDPIFIATQVREAVQELRAASYRPRQRNREKLVLSSA
jgi:cysteine desulfurase